ncbi:MAG: DUF6272 family protein [bacterium]
MTTKLDLEVVADWEEIDGIRTRTASFLRKLGLPASAIDAVSMVTCELSENAVKYGHYEDPEQRITIRVSRQPEGVTVEVRNPIHAEDELNLKRLDRMIQWIRGYQDPFEAYMERLKEVSSMHLDDAESGLGLVRIAYEGQSVLDFYVDEKNVLAVSAVYDA